MREAPPVHSTRAQINLYTNLGADPEEIAKLVAGSLDEGRQLISEKLRQWAKPLHVGVVFELQGRRGVITGQWYEPPPKNLIMLKILWYDNRRVESKRAQDLCLGGLQSTGEIDEKIRREEEFTSRILRCIYALRQEGNQDVPRQTVNLHQINTMKRALETALAEKSPEQVSDPEITQILADYWHNPRHFWKT